MVDPALHDTSKFIRDAFFHICILTKNDLKPQKKKEKKNSKGEKEKKREEVEVNCLSL